MFWGRSVERPRISGRNRYDEKTRKKCSAAFSCGGAAAGGETAAPHPLPAAIPLIFRQRGRDGTWTLSPWPLYLIPYLIIGWDVVWRAIRNIANGQVFDENFLMALATVGAFGTGEYARRCS